MGGSFENVLQSISSGITVLICTVYGPTCLQTGKYFERRVWKRRYSFGGEFVDNTDYSSLLISHTFGLK